MNKLFFSVVSLLAFTSCASEYKIEGSSSVSRLDGKMLFVKVPSGDRMLSIDSAEVIHVQDGRYNRFYFNGILVYG